MNSNLNTNAITNTKNTSSVEQNKRQDKIVICDDDKDIVRALEIYLSNRDYELLCAYTGREALDFVKKGDVSLVLLDSFSLYSTTNLRNSKMYIYKNFALKIHSDFSSNSYAIRGLPSDTYTIPHRTKPYFSSTCCITLLSSCVSIRKCGICALQ